MIGSWLTRKRIYDFLKAFDLLKKTKESFEQEEKDYLEKAAIEYEQAKKYALKKDIPAATHHLKLKLLHEHSAQNCRRYHLSLHNKLISNERTRLKLLEDLDNLTTPNPMHVFTIFCCFLLFSFSLFCIYVAE